MPQDVRTAVDAAARALPDIECRRDEPMNRHTSFKIGGAVAALFLPSTKGELSELLRLMHHSGVRPLIIGNGTNLLVDDQALDLVVIKTHGMLTDIRLIDAVTITAESGALLSRVAVFAQEHGLGGLEFAHGIPGTLGGAVAMNAGAFGGEMKDIVIETVSLSTGGERTVTSGDDHAFAYRRSRFSETDNVVVSSTLRLTPGDPETIAASMRALAEKRRASQPLELPSAGSTFKRPATGYAAALIDQAGLKGYAVGGAMVSPKHAGFVVNTGGASFGDVLAVMEQVQETVLRQFGIALEPEVKIIRADR